MDYLKIYKALPILDNYDENVVEWMDDFSRLMRICNIDDNKRIYNWAYEAVNSNAKIILKSLVEKKGNKTEEERYPSLREIQRAVEKSLGITDGDKLAYLQRLQIKEGETIKGFNERYRKLYHDLPKEFQKVVTIKNYRNAISSRSFPYSQVFISKCDNLSDAYAAAETAEEAEKEWCKNNNNSINNQLNNNIMHNVTMLTQGSSMIMSSPNFFPNRGNIYTNNGSNMNRYNRNNNNRYKNKQTNYNNSIPPFNFNRNNNNDFNYSSYINNNGNNNNYSRNFSNFNNAFKNTNISYGNDNFSNYNGNIYNSRSEGISYNNYPLNNLNNFNHYNNPYYQNQFYSNNNDNSSNESLPINNSNYKEFSGNNISKNSNKSNTSNVDMQNFNNNSSNNKTKKGVAIPTCYRCNQQGHKSSECPYTFKQLAEMEEKGLLGNNKHLN